MPLKNSDMNSNLTIAKEAKKLNEVKKGMIAETIPYDNEESGLSADNVQDAIDEVASGSGAVVDTGSDNLLLAYKLTSDRKEIAIPYTGPDIENILKNKFYVMVNDKIQSGPPSQYANYQMCMAVCTPRPMMPGVYAYVPETFLSYKGESGFRSEFSKIDGLIGVLDIKQLFEPLHTNNIFPSSNVTIPNSGSDYSAYVSINSKGAINYPISEKYGFVYPYDSFNYTSEKIRTTRDEFPIIHLVTEKEALDYPTTIVFWNLSDFTNASNFKKDVYVIIAVGDEAYDKAVNHIDEIEFEDL